LGEKKSIEELRAERDRLAALKSDKDERAKLEKEVKDLRNATGQVSLKRKVFRMAVKGVKAAGKQVAADLNATMKDLAEEDKPKKKVVKKDE